VLARDDHLYRPAAAAAEDDSLEGLRYERAEWLGRYWDMGDDEFRRRLIAQTEIEYPQLVNEPLPECFSLQERQPAQPDCKQQ
jgi:hypothetical protein